MTQKSALITGGTGFIGSNLTKRLIQLNWEVSLIVTAFAKLDSIKDVLGQVHLYKHNGSSEQLISIVKKAKPEIVFHLAALFLAQHKVGDIKPLVGSNVLFGNQVLEAMTKNKVYKLINTGTSWQHFGNQDYNPVCLYAATKQAFEAILNFYIETTPLKAVTLKLFDTYGCHDQRPKLFNVLNKAAKDGKPLDMSPGNQLLDLVYVDDIIDAYLLIAKKLLSGKIKDYKEYAVSSGRPKKLKEVVKIYEHILGKKLPVKWGGRSYRQREIFLPWTKGKLIPGWKPKVTLNEGIRKIVEEIQDEESMILR